jgi:tRNA pseudouridine38-40 synthase
LQGFYPLIMARIVLGIEYDGSGFCGWQRQAGQRTVQLELESALSKIANQPIHVVCAGRTDTGVHALEQVVHFDCEVQRELHAWVMGGNSQLPDDVRIIWAKPAVDDFHARFSAIARFYRYVILNRQVKSALRRHQVTWCYENLDADKMHRAAQALIGEQDFTSFRAHSCQSVSPSRLVYFVNVYRQDDFVIMDIAANAFVHHMVRNIAGSLMEVGRGKQSVDWIATLLKAKDRTQAGMTAPAEGLYLGGVLYPLRYGLDRHEIFKRLPEDAKRYD